jgi:hypothetical protein
MGNSLKRKNKQTKDIQINIIDDDEIVPLNSVAKDNNSDDSDVESMNGDDVGYKNYHDDLVNIGVRYKVVVCDDENNPSVITEIYLPAYNVCFNGKIVFNSNNPRTITNTRSDGKIHKQSLRRIKISRSLVNEIMHISRLQNEIDRKIHGLKRNEDFKRVLKIC